MKKNKIWLFFFLLLFLPLECFAQADVTKEILSSEDYRLKNGDFLIKEDVLIKIFQQDFNLEKTVEEGEVFLSLKNGKKKGLFLKKLENETFEISNQSFGVFDYNVRKTTMDSNRIIVDLTEKDYTVEESGFWLRKEIAVEKLGIQKPLFEKKLSDGSLFVRLREDPEHPLFLRKIGGKNLQISNQSFGIFADYNLSTGISLGEIMILFVSILNVGILASAVFSVKR